MHIGPVRIHSSTAHVSSDLPPASHILPLQHKHWQRCNFDDTEQFIANKLNLWVGTFEDANTGANNLRLWDLETETEHKLPGNYAKNAKPSIEVTLLRGRQYMR